MFMDCSLIDGWILENPVEFEKEREGISIYSIKIL
jgi:hypothetical protein